MPSAKITWTLTDEAPALASHALLPILRAFLRDTVEIVTADISLAGRILAAFPDFLREDQRVPDDLARLGALTQEPTANIVKLPNISATVPQLKAAIAELRGQGFAVPEYPEDPADEQERRIRDRYAVVLGSAVNPVLREGNSDRRPAAAVKAFARKHPHRMMKPWPAEGSRTRVAHMSGGDFYGSERSLTLAAATEARIEYVAPDGAVTVLKPSLPLEAGEILDSAVMRVADLRAFYAEQIEAARREGLLLSLHLKATMMKVSDPVLFGHAVSTFFAEVFERFAADLAEVGADPNLGLADLLGRLEGLPEARRRAIEEGIADCLERGPALAMVDSDRGITNLHVPNDVIIDASMPVVIRDGGRMWNRDGQLQDTLAMIPDRCYATIYQAVIEDCQAHGQFDPATMGNVANVGLMARKAEEYGSHDKTFLAPGPGVIRAVDAAGAVLLEQEVATGDIFRMCQTKDDAVRDWVGLAVRRARATGSPAVFWLDPARGHDAEIIRKVETYLPEHDSAGLDLRILPPVEAMRFTLERVRRGEDTISVTGNVLRDYLTDLFPILELGTSARMLSIVPLLRGGGLYETGAGGSAPKHVQQLLREGHLRWDSLGEYCALVPSLEQAAAQGGGRRVEVLARALDAAVGRYLEHARNPSRKVGEIDNRGSTAWLARYWAEALATQQEDPELAERFAPVAAALASRQEEIERELLAAQGAAVDLGGYYHPDPTRCAEVMRPSPTLNAIIDGVTCPSAS
ncbi:MAG: NADP-dependent isocitrate dehydrogenase [Planctomycetota bacterium]|nr:MAG: NADP-dependent isocitrate dehydrogenase [Planctomycetota bacterium]